MWLIELTNSRLLVVQVVIFVMIAFTAIWAGWAYFFIPMMGKLSWLFVPVIPMLLLFFCGGVWIPLTTGVWIVDFEKRKLSCLNVLRLSVSRDIHFQEVRSVETSSKPGDTTGIVLNLWLELNTGEIVFLQDGHIAPYKNVVKLHELLSAAILFE